MSTLEDNAPRIFGWLAIIAGLCLLSLAAQQEREGSATPLLKNYPPRPTVLYADDPRAFRGIMIYNWALGLGPILIGAAIIQWLRRQDSLNPLSPDYGGTQDIDFDKP